MDENEREAAIRDFRKSQEPKHDPILDLPLAHEVLTPRHLKLAAPGEPACGAKARTEMDTPYANVRNTIFCALAKGHEGQHFSSDYLPPARFIADGYRWT